MKLFDLSLELNGFQMKKATSLLQEINAVPKEAYAEFIERKKHEIVDFHLKNNSFYRGFSAISADWNWAELPVMRKRNLQVPLQERLSDGYSSRGVYVNKTSGSGGEPFIFAKDKDCHALSWANNIDCFGWHGIDFNKSMQARFYGIPLDFIDNKKERFKDLLSNRHRFPIFDLSDKVLEGVLQKFRSKKFDYINGYTSSIVLFAKFLKGKGIVLKQVCPTLKVCVVTSEMLFDSDKELLEKQLGIPVVNEYGASELDLIAFQNPKDEWQINNKTLFVEILDENDNILPNGTEGRIVITSLYNKAHPFIRYDIGDIGIIDEKSTASHQILKKLIGRTNDVAILPSGKKTPGLTFYYVTKTIIEDDGNVKEFIVRQVQKDKFEVDYVSDRALTPSQISDIEDAISRYLEPNLHFSFERKSSLSRNNRGKLKQFSRTFSDGTS